jgi:hypothetical protein
MSERLNIYEYHNGILGVQARYIFEGTKKVPAHPQSLRLVSYDAFSRMLRGYKIVPLRPRGYNQPLLVKYDSLPLQWQNLSIKAFGEPRKQVRKTLFEQMYERDTKAFNFYSLYRFPKGNQALDDSEVERYTLNASMLNTMQRLNRRRREYRVTLSWLDTGDLWPIICGEAIDFGEGKGHTLPKNHDRLRRLMAKYRKEGYLGLISGRHQNSNARIVTTDIELFINDLFADYVRKPYKEEVARQYEGFLDGYIEVINNTTGELYKPDDFPRLSTSTIMKYLSKWQNAIATEYIRGGDRQKFMAKFRPYHSLEQPETAGAMISVDDRQPPFEYEKGRRMWFYMGIDLGSEALVCWVYGKTKEGIILDFYRQMVRNYAEWGFNLPAELEGELHLNSSHKDTFLKEGNMFQYVRIEANNARGKRIEGYYRQLRYSVEKERPGWIARPFALDESNQAGPGEVPIIPCNEIIAGCLRDIETHNNAEHSKIKGKTRWEVFCGTQHPNIRPTNYRGFLPYLGYVTRSSCKTGIIKLQNSEFLLGDNGVIAVGSPLIDLMNKVEGREVTLFWLDGNNGKVLKAYVYVNNTFICEAIEKPAYNRARIEQTPQDLANRELMSKYVSTIEGLGRRRCKEIEKLTLIDNRPKTLNNSFRIRGLERYEAGDAIPELLPPPDFYEEQEEEYELIEVERPFKSGLKDRF